MWYKVVPAAVVAIIAVAAVWLERAHHVMVDAPVAAADAVVLAAGAGCPDNDTMPYSARCLDYLDIPAQGTPPLAVTVALESQKVKPMPCPDTDKVPYSASCIAFLKGATETGMRWLATDAPPPRL